MWWDLCVLDVFIFCATSHHIPKDFSDGKMHQSRIMINENFCHLPKKKKKKKGPLSMGVKASLI